MVHQSPRRGPYQPWESLTVGEPPGSEHRDDGEYRPAERDAGDRGVAGDERVRVSSRVGEVEAPLELTRAIMPGVVSLPHGWGHGRPGVR